jgi:starch phosphorylase
VENGIRQVPDDELWNFRNAGRTALIDYARGRFSRQLAVSGRPPDVIEAAKHIFDPNTLTLGFARRFATYKRPNLLLKDPERFIRLLTDLECPVQIIIAGKAHPADKPGQALIQEWTKFIRRPEVRGHVIFLSDYDMNLTKHLVQGVDVWLNTPRRPWEASGTSGMKVLVNGGINLSELDGWWAEAYTPEVGWAIGDGLEHGDDPAWDAAEAIALYERLENEVVPEFYNRDENGIPGAWINRMRESMAKLTPQFSANRTVREYTDLHYAPAAELYHTRAADKGAYGKTFLEKQRSLDQKWQQVRFGNVKFKTEGDSHVFEVQISLNDLSPDEVLVELYADGNGTAEPERYSLSLGRQIPSGFGSYVFTARVPASRMPAEYTPRIIPRLDGAKVPLEDNRILWQR